MNYIIDTKLLRDQCMLHVNQVRGFSLGLGDLHKFVKAHPEFEELNKIAWGLSRSMWGVRMCDEKIKELGTPSDRPAQSRRKKRASHLKLVFSR